MKTKFNAEVCPEQPCMLKVGSLAAMVLHVDDVLFIGDGRWIKETFFQSWRVFRLSSAVVG